MSDISGGQSTEQAKIEVIVNGTASKGFLDIVKTLQDLGAYVEKSVELLGRFEEKINNIGTAADNINKKTKKYSATSVSQIGKKKKAVTVLNDIPTDANTPAGKAGIERLKSQKQLIDAQKDLTKALEETTETVAKAKETNAWAARTRAEGAQKESVNRDYARGTWANMMSDPEAVQRRRAENWYRTQRFLDGSQKKEDDINQRLREARLTRETMLGGRRMFGGFDAQNIFNEGIRHSTNNAMNKKGFLGNFTRLGAMLNPRETFSKVGLFGMQLGHTGVAAGAVAAAGFGTALVGATTAIKKFSEVALSSYGELSKLKTSLGVVYGSEARADTVFDAIADYAVKSPFGVSQLTEMATLLKQSGIYESDLLDTLKTIGDLAGGNEEKYRRIANNYAQVLAIGKATTKDMREFANAGVPIFEATSDYLGISRKDLAREIEQGNVTAQVLEGVFKKLTSEGGVFYQATEKGSKTYAARKVNIQDAQQLALSEFGEAIYKGNLFGIGGKGLPNIYMDAVESFFQWFQEFGQGINQKGNLKKFKNNEDYLVDLKNELSEMNRLLEAGIYVSDDSIEKLKDAIQERETKYSTDEENKVLNESYLAQEKKLLDAIEGFGSMQEMERQFLEIGNKLSTMLYDPDITSQSAITRYRLEEDYNKLALMMLKLAEVESFLSNLYGSREFVGHTMVTYQNLAQESQDYFNKQSSYNKESSQNRNQTIRELYQSTDYYKKEQERLQLEELQKTITDGEYATAQGLGSGFSWALRMSKDEFKSVVEKYFKASGAGLFDKTQFERADVQKLKENTELILGLSGWSTETTKSLSSLSYNMQQALNQDNEKAYYQATQIAGMFIKNLESSKNPDKDFLKKLLTSDLEYEGIETGLANVILDEMLKKQKEAATPLWSRITGGIFDWAPENLEWTSYRNVDKGYDHSYGLKAYYTGDYKYSGKDVLNRGSMFSKQGVTDFLNATGSAYLDKLVFAKDKDGKLLREGVNKIAQYDWNGSLKALENVALSLDSSSEATNALADFYKREREKFTSYITDGIITGEDWEKLLDPTYQSEFGYKGEEFEQLINSLSTYVDENGVVDSEGMQYALKIEALLKETESLTSQFANLKNSVIAIRQQTEDVNFKTLALQTGLFGNVTTAQSGVLSENIMSAVRASLANQKELTDTQRNEYLKKTTEYTQLALSEKSPEDIENLSDIEKSLIEILKVLIEETQNNTSALLGYDISAKLKEAGGGKLSYDAGTMLFSGQWGRTDSFGDNATQQRIKSTFGTEQYSFEQLKQAITKTPNLQESIESSLQGFGIDTSGLGLDEILDKFSLITEATKVLDESLYNVVNGSVTALKNALADGIVSSFYEIGKTISDSEKSSKGLADAWKELGRNLFSQISTLLVTEGLRIMGSGAVYGSTTGDWSKFYLGLAMVAGGGMGSLLSGMMSSDKKSDESDKEVERLQSIKDMLADLLAQARVDAEYYEKNLRHQKAISANEALSTYKVNDAVITPKGDIISTHPDDWLIATKTPHELSGGSAPVVTITIVNESGNTVQVARTEQSRNGNNIDVKAIVIATVNEALADGALDGGLQAASYRRQGKVVSY